MTSKQFDEQREEVMFSLKRFTAATAIATTLAFGATAVPAAQVLGGLVNVNISNIRVDIADVLDVNENQIPVTVTAPIGIAANVCNIGANVLAAAVAQGGAECTAEEMTNALVNLVAQQM